MHRAESVGNAMSKQRYEKEIEEILSKYDQEKGRTERKPSDTKPIRDFRSGAPGRGTPRNSLNMPNWKRLSAGQYIAAAFGVALLAILVRSVAPLLASIMVLLAVVLFLVPIVVYRSTGTTSGGWSANEEKRWRGQVIDFSTRRDVTNDPLASIKRWFKRR
jgi:hypothetical protein